MAIADTLKSLQDFDTAELTNPDAVGVWPMPIKAIVWLLAFGIVCFLGYNYTIKDKQAELERVKRVELDLRKQYSSKAFEVANLDALKAQLVEMEDQFGALIAQLPKDTEVPGLLEDITEKGTDAGLTFASISLQGERAAEFYVELPIDVQVVGSYHDFGGFTSGVAGLSRIVTLHDFSILPGSNAANLKMQIQAKTYRYKGEE